MTSTFVNDLRLNEQATGDNSGSWGTVTNTNLELIGDAFGYGTEAITTDADTHNTIIVNAPTVSVGRSMFLKYTGALNSPCTVTITNSDSDFTISKLWFIHNATTGGEDIIITSGSGANVTIPAGHTKCIYTDGAGSGGAVVDGFAGLSAGANLYVKNPATTDNSTANIYLQTAEADIAVNDVLGKINFQAPDETSHASGDNKLVAAAIQAISEGDFSQTNNATSLAFMTAASEAATTKMTLSSVGDLTLTSTTASSSSTTGAVKIGGGLGVAADLFVGDDLDVTGAVVIDETALITGVLTTTAKAVSNGGIGMPDDAKLTFGGTGDGDLQIYHSGSHSYINEQGTGNLNILASNQINILNADSSSYLATFVDNGASTLFWGATNSAKIATKATGVTVTGEMAATTMDLSSNAVIDGSLAVGAALSSGYNASITGAVPLNTVVTSTASSVSYGGLGVTRNHTGTGQGTGIGFLMNSANGTSVEYGYIGTIIESNADSNAHDGSIGLFPVLNSGRVQRFTVKSSGDCQINDGNLVVAAGHGIDFSAQTASGATGASASSELLDHYEEGTWTPVVAGADTAGTPSFSSRTGFYTRIGRLVHIDCVLAFTISGEAGTMQISGMPFQTAAESVGTFQCNNMELAYQSNVGQYSARVADNATLMTFRGTKTDGGEFAAMAAQGMSFLRVALQYQTD